LGGGGAEAWSCTVLATALTDAVIPELLIRLDLETSSQAQSCATLNRCCLLRLHVHERSDQSLQGCAMYFNVAT